VDFEPNEDQTSILDGLEQLIGSFDVTPPLHGDIASWSQALTTPSRLPQNAECDPRRRVVSVVISTSSDLFFEGARSNDPSIKEPIFPTSSPFILAASRKPAGPPRKSGSRTSKTQFKAERYDFAIIQGSAALPTAAVPAGTS
jgi:hypothetical protein